MAGALWKVVAVPVVSKLLFLLQTIRECTHLTLQLLPLVTFHYTVCHLDPAPTLGESSQDVKVAEQHIQLESIPPLVESKFPTSEILANVYLQHGSSVGSIGVV